jgi:hypothetical protein
VSRINWAGAVALVNTPTEDGRVLLLSAPTLVRPARSDPIPVYARWKAGEQWGPHGAISWIGRIGDRILARGWVESDPLTRHLADDGHAPFSIAVRLGKNPERSPDGLTAVFEDWTIDYGFLHARHDDRSSWGLTVQVEPQ